MLPFKLNHSGRPVALIYLPCRFYLKQIFFISFFIYCPYYAWEGKGRFIKNPGIIAFKRIPLIEASQFLSTTTICAAFVRLERVWPSLPHCFSPIWDFFCLCAARSVPGQLYSLALRELTFSWGEFDKTIVCFHMTSWRPYLCPKTMKWRPCWPPVLRESNSFLM